MRHPVSLRMLPSLERADPTSKPHLSGDPRGEFHPLHSHPERTQQVFLPGIWGDTASVGGEGAGMLTAAAATVIAHFSRKD